jgi:ornithine cyclodeaminase
MPTWRGGESPAWALKEIAVAFGNPARGLDSHQGAVLLHDGETGELRAVLNASAVTSIRTAAVSGVATQALARPSPSRVAILGTGVQARSHVDAMRVSLNDPEIVVWSPNRAHTERFAADVGAVPGESAEEAVRDADVVCTTTTAVEPIVSRSWLGSGAHLNAVGSCFPHTRELDSATVESASLFVDRRESALAEAGDVVIPISEGLIGPDHIRAELGEVLAGLHRGRERDDELTVFESLGIAVEDLAAAEVAVRRARELGIGSDVAF